jgi:predicted metal-dependent HD superfamily phosphohydrolase
VKLTCSYDQIELQFRGRLMKKIYEKPAIIHTEKLEARAVTCTKSTDTACAAGPIQS